MNENKQVGIINEIGDLGLGFDPISENDQKLINEQINQDVLKDKDKKEG